MAVWVFLSSGLDCRRSKEDVVMHNYDIKKTDTSCSLRLHGDVLDSLAAEGGTLTAPTQRRRPHLELCDVHKPFLFLMLHRTWRLLHHHFMDSSLYKLFIVTKVISTMESLALWKATFQLLFHKSHLLKIQLMFGFRPEVPRQLQQKRAPKFTFTEPGPLV